MSQTFLTKSVCKSVDLEPIASVGHDAVLTRGRRSTKEGGALLTNKIIELVQKCKHEICSSDYTMSYLQKL